MKAEHSPRVLLTGASGFIGQNLLRSWNDAYSIVPVRFSETEVAAIPVQEGDVVIHLAGIAHQSKTLDPSVYDAVNHIKAVGFARSARDRGAAHFIFMSTTKVYGVNVGRQITEETPCRPADPYGTSKLRAEEGMTALRQDGFRVSIMRPPLVYGAGVKGNMLQLLRLCASGRPLPFKGISNERTLVFVGNLLAMLDRIVTTGREGVFIPADDSPMSTQDILRIMKACLQTRNREIPFPWPVRKLLSLLLPGKADKLFGSLVFDNTRSRNALSFENPFTTPQGFAEMARWFQQESSKKS